MAHLSADVSQMRDLAKRLRAARPDVHQAMTLAVGKVGRIIRDDAKTRSSWSAKIPATIRYDVSGGSAAIRAGNSTVPEAVLYERPKGWRHPLFGDRKHWYGAHGNRLQGPRRYLHPALDANKQRGTALVTDAVVNACQQAVDGD